MRTESGYGYVGNPVGTSATAARERAPKTVSLRADIIAALELATAGATPSELVNYLSARQDTSSISARLADLKRDGLVTDVEFEAVVDGQKNIFRAARYNERGRTETVVALTNATYDPKGTTLCEIEVASTNHVETIDNAIIRLLSEYPEGLTARELMKMSGRARASVTGNLAHLKNDGYVREKGTGEVRDGQAVLVRTRQRWIGKR